MFDWLNQPVFGFLFWQWMIAGIVTIIVVTILLARKMEFEGVNITATPPFFAFRFKRKQTRQVSQDLTGLPASVNTAGGAAQLALQRFPRVG